MLFAVGRPHHESEFYHPATKKFQSHHSIDMEDFIFPESGSLAAVTGLNFPMNSSHADKDTFEVKVDIHHYRPDELIVKTVNNYVVVTGKHEERHNDDGQTVRDTREFIQRYSLPHGVFAETVTCVMGSTDGMLHISAPMHHGHALQNGNQIPVSLLATPNM